MTFNRYSTIPQRAVQTPVVQRQLLSAAQERQRQNGATYRQLREENARRAASAGYAA